MPSIQEPISAAGDDCKSAQTLSNSVPASTFNAVANNSLNAAAVHYVYPTWDYRKEQRADFRFTGLELPNGATIDSASITTITGVHIDTEPTLPIWRFWGDDVDDAAAWSSGNAPRHITKTTASAVADTTLGTTVQDVTAIVQEIVERGGWASGNAMRFQLDSGGLAAVPSSGVYKHSLAINAYEKSPAGTLQAVLDVTYTEASEAGTPPQSSMLSLSLGLGL